MIRCRIRRFKEVVLVDIKYGDVIKSSRLILPLVDELLLGDAKVISRAITSRGPIRGNSIGVALLNQSPLAS